MAFTITVRSGGHEFKKEYKHEIKLNDVIAESGFLLDRPCGGRGVCGNCRVKASGCLSLPTEKEREFLGAENNHGTRLACMAYAFGDVFIEIPKNNVIDSGLCNDIATEIAPVTGNKSCFACAVDIGTTTVVFRYYSLPEGRIVFNETVANPQRIRGGDVLTRIAYASNDNGLFELKELTEKAIFDSALRFGRKVEFYIMTGNTAMLHILSGRSTKGLATAPFSPETLFGYWEGNRYYMRCASAYIGGDAVASLLAAGMAKTDRIGALLDIGTNNECILWDGKDLFACSSPAGPAFEGGNISCGMAASGSAICSISEENGNAIIRTVEEDYEPTGFCGSGLIDAVAYLFRNGYIARDGSVIKPLPYFGKAKLLAEDIAELQLAKSAVCAGLMTLLDKAGKHIDDLEKLYLTGSFGNKINSANAELIGMIPKGSANTAVASVYGAIDGAAMLVLNEKAIKESDELASRIETVELADSKFFEKAFIENMYF